MSTEKAESISRAPGDVERESLSIFGLANLLLPYWKWLLVLPLMGAIGAVAFALFTGGAYAATSSFASATADRNSGIAGVAAQFGFSVPGGGGTETPEFYEDLITSNVILSEVASTTYSVQMPGSDSTVQGLIADFHDIDGETPEIRVGRTIGELRDMILTATDPVTGVVVLTTVAEYPALAIGINRRILELLNQFNLEQRQTRAKEERSFVSARLTEAQSELVEAESALERFLQTNRTYQSSPSLAFEAARLERRVDLRQQVSTSLAQAYETARIEEVRNTPVLTLIEQPDLTVRKRPSRLALWGALGFLATALATLVTILVVIFLRAQREREPGEYQRLRAAASATWPRLTSRLRGGPER